MCMLVEKDCATHNDINKFQIDERKCLVTLMVKIRDENSVLFSVVKCTFVLDPKVLVWQPLDIKKSLFKRLLYTLFFLKIICSSQTDLALSKFSSFYHTSLRQSKTSFESFQVERDLLDDFYVKEINICKYEIASIFNIALVWSHGQAAKKVGFSVSNKVLNVNMHEISITSRKLIINHMNSHTLAAVIINRKESVKISEVFSANRVIERERIVTETTHSVLSYPSLTRKLRKWRTLLLETLKLAKTFILSF